jgi:hypothetical protein
MLPPGNQAKLHQDTPTTSTIQLASFWEPKHHTRLNLELWDFLHQYSPSVLIAQNWPILRHSRYLVQEYLRTLPVISLKIHIISKFPNRPTGCRRNHIDNSIPLITEPESTNRIQRFPNLCIKNLRNDSPQLLATAHSKNRWAMDSFSQQKRQSKSSNFFLLLRLSRVSSLFLVNNHRKHWTLGGILRNQMDETNNGCTPLKLTILYKDCTE